MAQYDGSIHIDTKIDQSGFDKGLAELSSKGKSFLNDLNGVFIGAIAALTAGAVVEIAKIGKAYESAFAGVLKTVNGSDEQLESIRKGILEMSTQKPTSAVEIAGVAEAAGQLGIATDDILSFTSVMTDMGVATNMSAADAATALARLANITGMSSKDYGKLGATIVDLGNNLATTESEIVNMALRVAGAGTTAHMSLPDILAWSGAMSSLGIRAEMGGSALSRVIKMMQISVETGADSLNGFAQVSGMTSDQFAKLFKDNPSDALMAFMEGLHNSEKQGKSATVVLKELSGQYKDLSSLKTVAISDVLLRSANGIDTLHKALGHGQSAWDAETALVAEAERRYSTFDSQLQFLKNNVSYFAIDMYGDMKKGFTGIVSESNTFVESLRKAFEEGGVEQVLAQLPLSISDFADYISEHAVDVTNSFGEIWEGIINGIGNAGESIIRSADYVIVGLIDAFGGIYIALFDQIQNNGPYLADAFFDILDQLVETVFQVSARMVTAAGSLMTSFASSMSDKLPELAEDFAYGLQNLVGAIAEVIPQMIVAAQDMMFAFITAITNNIDNLLGTEMVNHLYELAVRIAEVLPTFVETITYALMDLIIELASVLRDSFPTFIEAVKTIFEAIAKEIPTIVTFLVEAVTEIAWAVCDLIRTHAPEFVKAALDVVNALVRGFPLIISMICEIVPLLLQTLIQTLIATVPALLETAVTIVTTIVESLPEIFEMIIELIPVLLAGICAILIESLPIILEGIIQIITSICEALPDLITMLVEMLPTIIEIIVTTVVELAYMLVEAAATLVLAIVDALPDIITALLDVLPEVILQIVTILVECLLENIPVIVEAGIQFLGALLDGVFEIIEALVPKLPEIVGALVQELLRFIPDIIECGIQLLTAIVQDAAAIIGKILPFIPVLIFEIVNALIGLIPQLIECGILLFTSLISSSAEIIAGIIVIIPQVIDSLVAGFLSNIDMIAQAGLELLISLILLLPDIVVAITDCIPDIIEAICRTFLSLVGSIAAAGLELFVSLIKSTPQIIATIVDCIPEIVNAICDGFLALVDDLKDVGYNLIMGLWDGVMSTWDWMYNAVTNFAGNIVDWICDSLWIFSPSRLMRDKVGKNIVRGIVVGIEDEEDTAKDAMENLADDISGVEFEPPVVPAPEFEEFELPDDEFDALAEMLTGAVTAEIGSNANDITAGITGEYYARSNANAEEALDNEKNEPQFVENIINIDGRETARVITPYVSKQLSWEDT